MNNEAPDTGVVVCPQCDNDTPEHYMIWDGEKNTVCLWCDEEADTLTTEPTRRSKNATTT